MFNKIVPTAALAVTANAYEPFHGESYELEPIEFEDIFKHALPQKEEFPAVVAETKTAAAYGWEDALTSGSTEQSSAIVNNVIASFRLNQQASVPACTSLGCSKGSVAKPPTDTVPTTDNWGKKDSDWGVHHAADFADLVQLDSVPACSSAGCKKDSYAKPPSNAAETEKWGLNNEDWMKAYDAKLV